MARVISCVRQMRNPRSSQHTLAHLEHCGLVLWAHGLDQRIEVANHSVSNEVLARNLENLLDAQALKTVTRGSEKEPVGPFKVLHEVLPRLRWVVMSLVDDDQIVVLGKVVDLRGGAFRGLVGIGDKNHAATQSGYVATLAGDADGAAESMAEHLRQSESIFPKEILELVSDPAQSRLPPFT